MFSPGRHIESEALAGFLDQQLSSIRASTHGLTDEQARQTPCRSALSIGGLVKHATYVLQGRERDRTSGGAVIDEAALLALLAAGDDRPADSQ